MMLFPIFAVLPAGRVVFVYLFIRQDIYSMYLSKKPAAAQRLSSCRIRGQ